MEAAAALFGEVLLAINFPNSAMTQFNAGKPWDVVRNDGGIEGGHAICSARYDSAKPSSGRSSRGPRSSRSPSPSWRSIWTEAWVAVSPEWVAANGKTPSGLDLARSR
jgi:hypothetical protein